MTTEMQTPEERIRSVGMRVTSPRLATFVVVAENPHIAAEEVAVRVRERLGTVSTQAVYDALRACTSAGLMRRIEPAGSPARYECRTGDNHHHLVCRQCGRIEDIECAVGHAPCLTAEDDLGFLIDEAEVNYWGVCPECQAEKARLD